MKKGYDKDISKLLNYIEERDSLKDYSTKIDFFRKEYLYNFKNTNRAIKDFIMSLT